GQLRPLDLGAAGVVEQVVVAASHAHAHQRRLRASHAAVVAVEAGDGADPAVGCAAHRDPGIEGHRVVDALDVEIDPATLELAPEADAQLATPVAGEAEIAHAVLAAVEAAHAQRPSVANRSPVPEIGAEQAGIADRQLHEAFRLVPGPARDEVDRTRRRVRIEHRRRPATDDLDALVGLVEAERLVAV